MTSLSNSVSSGLPRAGFAAYSLCMPDPVHADARERRRQLTLYAVAGILSVLGVGFLVASAISFQRGDSTPSAADAGGEPTATPTTIDTVAGERTPGTTATAAATPTSDATETSTPGPPTTAETPAPEPTETPTIAPTSTPVPPAPTQQAAAPEPTAASTEEPPTPAPEPTATEEPSGPTLQIVGPAQVDEGATVTYTAAWNPQLPPDVIEWQYAGSEWLKVGTAHTVTFGGSGCEFVWVRGWWFAQPVDPNPMVRGVAVQVGEVEGGCSSFSN